MHLYERVNRLEQAIVAYYNKKGEKKVGHTMLHNIKQMVDYTINNDSEWDKEYLKQLMVKADELRIPDGDRA